MTTITMTKVFNEMLNRFKEKQELKNMYREDINVSDSLKLTFDRRYHSILTNNLEKINKCDAGLRHIKLHLIFKSLFIETKDKNDTITVSDVISGINEFSGAEYDIKTKLIVEFIKHKFPQYKNTPEYEIKIHGFKRNDKNISDGWEFSFGYNDY